MNPLDGIDYLEPIQSQYSSSPRILALSNAVCSLIEPKSEIQMFYENVLNIDTASLYGLRIWARIVGLSKTGILATAPDIFNFFQTDLAAAEQTVANFNNGPFYSPALDSSGFMELGPEALRWLIYYKAQANISGDSLADLNQSLRIFVDYMRGSEAEVGTYVIETGVMELTVSFGFLLSEYENNIITQFGLFNRGAGVDIKYRMMDFQPPFFGFVQDDKVKGIFGEAPFYNDGYINF